MKIVILKSHFITFGGLEKYTLRIAQAFRDKGHEVFILTTTSSSLPVLEGVKIIPLGSSSKLSFYHIQHFDALCQTWISKHPVDIIFGMERNRIQTHYRAGSGVHAAFLKQRTLIEPFLKRLSFQFNPLHRMLLKIEKEAFLYKGIKKIFTNSWMVYNEILEYYPVAPSLIEVIPNGVEWHEYQTPFELKNRLEIQKNLTLDPNKIHFLFIGNGYQRKGLSFLIQALGLLRRDDIHLSVVGKDKNPSFFQNLAKKNHIEKNISFFGAIHNPISFYKSADCLVIPSIYDPCANVTLEALAMGLFIVTSPFNGAKEILSDKTGIQIKNLLSPESVKEALDHAIQHPKTEKSAKKIRESVKDLDFSFQLDKIVNSTLNSV